MRIPDKDTYKRLSTAGLLGNTFQQWESLETLRSAGYQGHVTLRARRPGDKVLFVPCIHTDNLTAVDASRVYIQECPPPDAERIINLEAARTPLLGHQDPVGRNRAGLYVRYSPASPLNLRHDLEQNGRDVEGLEALMVLRRYLQEDLDALHEIWDLCPDAVIEASRFSRACGTQNRKTIFWEVRDY